MSPQTVHFWVLHRNLVLGPGKGSPSCNKTRRKEKRHRLDLFVFPSPPHLSPCRWTPSPPGLISVPDERNPDSLTQVRPPCQDPRSFSSPPAHHTIQFSCSVVSDSLQSHGLQHARRPRPSPTPGAYHTLLGQLIWSLPSLLTSELCDAWKDLAAVTLTLVIRQTSTSVKRMNTGTSLGVQWLRLQAPIAGVTGSIPGQRIRSHLPQLRVHIPQLRVLIPQLKKNDPACRSEDWWSQVLQLRTGTTK